MLFNYLHLDNQKESSRFQGDAHNITVESCQAYPPRVLINESIIWEMNPLVVAATSKFNSILHFWMRNEQWISFDWTSLYSTRSTKIFEWKKIDLKRFSPDEIQECLAGRNFMASSLWIHCSLRMQECRYESEINCYQRIQVSNHKFFSGILMGALDWAWL